MKKETAFILVIAAMILSCTGYSDATILGTIETERSGFVQGFVDNLDVGLEYGYLKISIIGETPQYDTISWNITEDNIGWTSEITAETSPNFDNFVTKLTNGINDRLFIASLPLPPLPSLPLLRQLILSKDNIREVPPQFVLEDELIKGFGNGVDFEGYTIDSIALTVNDIFLDYDGVFTNYNYNVTYTINGEMIAIPEPATILLLGLGTMLLRKKR